MNRIELQKKWWIAKRPRHVKGPELEKALGLVEDTADEKRIAALATVAPAIAKVRGQLDKELHESLLRELAALQDLADAETRKLVAAAKTREAAKAKEKDTAKGENRDPAEEALFDPGLHRATLKRALRQPMVFAFAVSTKAEERALAVAPRGNPIVFARMAKARTGVARIAFGRAQASERDPGTLVLTLEGPMVPGTVKALRAYLKEHKITLFKNISLSGDEDEQEG